MSAPSPSFVRPPEQTWQERLLPLMIWMLAGLTVFFLLASLAQLFYLHSRIENAPQLRTDEILSSLNGGSSSQTADERLRLERLRTAAILEANLFARRYHQANVLLMSRVWSHYLGFVTGMILALVGAAFTLGQLRVSGTQMEAKSEHVQMTLRSASPGIILSFLGVVLMVTTIVTHHDIQTNDNPVYFGKEDLGFQGNRPPSP